MSVALLKRVELKNILSHENTTVELPRGLVAIVGPNGAGKSTIIDSVVYALLYSGRGSSGIRGGRKSDILRRGARSGEIVVEFEVGGRLYRVRRRISSGRPEEAELYEVVSGREKLLARGLEQVYRGILSILRIPVGDVLRASIISRQDELTLLIDSPPAKRKQMILQLLGLEELEKVRELLGEEVRKLAVEKGRGIEIERSLARKKRRISELGDVVRRLEEEVRSYEERVEELRRELEQRRQRLALLEELRALYEVYRLLEDKRRVSRSIECVVGAIKFLEDVEGIDVDYLGKLLRDYEDAKAKAEQLRRRVEDTRRRLESIIGAGRSVAMLEEELRKAIEEEQKTWAELEIMQGTVRVIEGSGVCPVCGRELTAEDVHRIKQEVVDKLKLLRSRIEELRRRRRELEERLERAKAVESEVARLEGAVSEVDTRISELRKRVLPIARRSIELYRSIKELVGRGSLPLCDEEARYVASVFSRGYMSALKELQRYLNTLKGRLRSYEEMLRSLEVRLRGIDERRVVERFQELTKRLGIPRDSDVVRLYDDAKREAENLEQELHDAEKRLESLKSRLTSLLEQKTSLEREVREYEEELREIKRKERLYDLLEILRTRILGKDGEIAKRLTARARTMLERFTNEILRHLGLPMSVRITPDFDMVVVNELGEIPVKNLSGGEKTALAISMRIALAYTIMGRMPSFFILDEPTVHLDEERRRSLFDMIRRISGRLPQVIVVTHDREVIDIADHVLEVFKEGTRSYVRPV